MVRFTKTTQSYHVPARTGRAFAVRKGDLIRITDLAGQQPCDFWAFNRRNPKEFISAEHTKPSILKLFPRVGDSAYTNLRRAIVTVVEDHSPGQHDMEFAACDGPRYKELGVKGKHASCQDNLHKAMRKVGVRVGGVRQPWNLFTNFRVNPDGTFTIKAPDTKPGDNIVLRAEMDAIIAVSACPQDQNPTCGFNPTDLKVEVGRA
ncbi:MAG: DUF1989 domain-containing protein [Alphaproteobacteria bacterium]